MKVILRKEHEKLGQIGSIVEVKDGYARNYLIPRGIAYPATPETCARSRRKRSRPSAALRRNSRPTNISPPNWTRSPSPFQMKVGEDEKLFGSVTSQMIADALKEKGFSIDKRIIDLEEPIKALGIYTVNVKLHQNVTGKVKVWVVRE